MRLRRLVRTATRQLGQRDAHNIPTGPVAPGVKLRHLRARDGRGKPQALNRPPSVPIRALQLSADELVLGIEHDGDARGYPLSTLWPHHVVNEVVGFKPVVVSLCMKCFSGMAFDPLVEGSYLQFGVYGTYRGALVLRDEQTGTLWAHLTGRALAGPLAGRRMATLPLEVTTLSRWMERHPDSMTPDPRVLAAARRVRPRGRARGRRKVLHGRGPLRPQSWVLGVSIGGRSRAYVMDFDHPGPPLYQDDLGEVPIALLAPAGAWPLVFDRRTPSGVVDLRSDGDGFVDASGSRWTDRGRAIEGPLVGTALEIVPSRIVEWHAWSAYYPDTDVVRPPTQGARAVSGT